MGRSIRSLLLFGVLSLWLSSAGAFCVSEVAYDYVMREDGPAPEQSLPCCVASGALTAPLLQDRSSDGRSGHDARCLAAAYPATPSRSVAGTASPLRWRAYCERSSRLLR